MAIAPATADEESFKAGLTDYYSVLTMTRLGFFDERTMFFKFSFKHNQLCPKTHFDLLLCATSVSSVSLWWWKFATELTTETVKLPVNGLRWNS